MVEERPYVAKCAYQDCGVRFVGATPDDVRNHMTTEHSPLAELIVFPTEAEKRRQRERTHA